MYGTGPTYEEYKRDLEVARNGHEQAARERIIVTLGLLLECSTVWAQKKVQHRIQTFSVQELFRDQDDAGRLNQSSVNRRRSEIQDDPNSGITTIGTLPAWVFPSFVQAALEPSFGEHFDIIDVKVPEARLQCIPALDSEEYRRLIEMRNQMWETIIRAFPEIDDWLVGPEPSYSHENVTVSFSHYLSLSENRNFLGARPECRSSGAVAQPEKRGILPLSGEHPIVSVKSK